MVPRAVTDYDRKDRETAYLSPADRPSWEGLGVAPSGVRPRMSFPCPANHRPHGQLVSPARCQPVWMRIVCSLLVFLTLSAAAAPTPAAEPELVGALALALESAEELKLSDKQREQLSEIVDKRELAGLNEVTAIGTLPREERLERLAPFRAESVRLGMQVLSEVQQQQLNKLRAKSNEPAYAIPGEQAQQAESASEKPAPDSSAPQKPQPGETQPSETQPSETATPGTAMAATEESSPEEPSTDETQPDAASKDEPQPEETPPQTPPSFSADGKLTFNFRYQPWREVLDWFAEGADLSLVLESPPPGTFNYQDTRSYTVGEALDVMNSVLLTKGFTLVRKGRMLLLVNLQDGIPPNLVSDVPLDQLDERGEYELVRVLFRVHNLSTDDAAKELEQLVGRQGEVLALPKAGMIQVTETAGRIRAIRAAIEAIEQPAGDGGVREFPLKYAAAGEVLPIIRQMLGIPEDELATPSGSFQMAVDPLGMKLFAQGPAVQLRRLEEVLRLVDVPEAAAGSGLAQTPQLAVYNVSGADPELVLRVLQEILAGNEATRLSVDAETGALVALATPDEHNTIRELLKQMQQDARQISVIPLDTIDPQLAVLSINKLFSRPGATEEKPDPRAPIVDADLSSRSLIVRALPNDTEQIKAFLNDWGEGQASLESGSTGNVRLLQMSPAAARSALEQIEPLWPMVRPNKIRVVTPSAKIPAYQPGEMSESPAPVDPLQDLLGPQPLFGPPPQPETSTPPNDRSASTSPSPREASGWRGRSRVPATFANQAEPTEPAEGNEPQPSDPVSRPGAEIVVAPGPGGLIIASADLEALDAFEQLLRASAGQTASGNRQFAVFYLKHAEALTIAEILGQVFGASSGGGDIIGDMAGAALGGLGGGLMGDLLGLGGDGGSSGGFASASVDIVPDARLNALVVYAQPTDLDTIDQLLQVLDQRTGPTQVEAGGKARLIPVVNTSAAQVAEVVQKVFQDRIQGTGGGGQQPSPQELLRALRRGGGGNGGGSDQEPSKMSIGVDVRSNSIVVRAPDPLFEQVKQLVQQLDEQGLGVPQSTRIVSLRHTNSAAIKTALESLLGEQAVTTGTGSSANVPGANRAPGGGDNAGRMMQQMEMFRRMQQMRQEQQRNQGEGRGRRGGGERGGGERGGRGGGR